MDTIEFYKLIDKEIDLLLIEHSEIPFLKKLKTTEGKKSFGFLLWFLNKYSSGLKDIESYITDGNDDASCDIIFDNIDNFGKKVFYVVQSKWCIEGNVQGNKGTTKEIKACLSDFALIYKGNKSKSSTNIKFNNKYGELLDHISNSYEVKFIFLTLSTGKHDAKDNITEFNKDAPFEIMNIDRLKRDYVEMEYKGAKTHNPIETPYQPKGNIEIEFTEGNNISISSPYPSYILLVKPKLFFDLFTKYGFALFYNNIRNPLFSSNFNENIATTIKDNPYHFWYFNNGITAISDNIGVIRSVSKKVTVQGLQIINGAQTAFSIYNSYKSATQSERSKMDADAIITLRLLKSGGKDFDLNVTRYTNSQNPVSERDFHANDDIQIQLQNEFLDNTNVWYERRRGEFRKTLKSTRIISNEYFGQTYLAFVLQNPLDAKGNIKRLFISEKNDKDGLYESVFNSKTKYDDMLVSVKLFEFIEWHRREINKRIKKIEPDADGEYTIEDIELLKYEFVLHSSFHLLMLFNIVLLKTYEAKSMNGIVISNFEKNKLDTIDVLYTTIVDKVKDHILNEKNRDRRFTLTKYFKSPESLAVKELF